MSELNLYFMHPLYGTTFQASIDLGYRVSEVLELLSRVGFLPELEPGQRYGLALYGQELDEDSILGDWADLADEDILRVVLHQAPKVEKTDNQEDTHSHLACFLALPQGLFLPWDLDLEQDAIAFVSELEAVGLLEAEGKWILRLPGGKVWGAEEKASELGLALHSLLRFEAENPQAQGPSLPDLQTQIGELGAHLGQMQEQLNAELHVIRNAIPLPYTIPLDYEKAALNPTEFPYRNLDGLLSEIRATAGLKPFGKITTKHWMPWVLAILLLLLLGLGIYLIYEYATT